MPDQPLFYRGQARGQANLPTLLLAIKPEPVSAVEKSMLAVMLPVTLPLVLACTCSLFWVTLTESFNGRIGCLSHLPPKQ